MFPEENREICPFAGFAHRDNSHLAEARKCSSCARRTLSEMEQRSFVRGECGMKLEPMTVSPVTHYRRQSRVATMTSQWVSNLLQVLAYMVGPVVLGAMLFYGISRSRIRRDATASKAQDDAIRKLYSEAEAERSAKERAAEKSSKPIDVIERRSGLTG